MVKESFDYFCSMDELDPLSLAAGERLRKFYFPDVNFTDAPTTPRFLFVRGIVLSY